MDEQWSDNGAPLIPPDSKFRQDLARALQDTHHRQRVQRQLRGASSIHPNHTTLWNFAGAISLLLLVFGIGYYLGRRNR